VVRRVPVITPGCTEVGGEEEVRERERGGGEEWVEHAPVGKPQRGGWVGSGVTG